MSFSKSPAQSAAVPSLPRDFEALANEHSALLAQYGRVQRRCSEVVAAQAAEIGSLKAEAMRLRAAVIVRDTALACAQEDQAALPGLPKRQALARRVEALVQRLQDLLRERLRWQIRAVPLGTAEAGLANPAAVAPETGLQASAVLCVGKDPSAASAARQMVEQAGGQFMHHDGRDHGDSAALDASLAAADLVICQTGCVSHNAYWRVQDHCKRTGKQCVLVDRPQALRFVRSVDARTVSAGEPATRP